MPTRFLLSFAFLGALEAQQVVAPTPDQVGSSRGENVGNYNVTNSFETGYRWSRIDGNLGKYRSDVNYRNGIRLLGSSLTVNSKDGHGPWFDEIVLTTIGLGNDPYQSAVLRAQKNRLYRYDMSWRLNEYYNPGLTISAGAHLLDTRRRLQDHDLTLLPQSPVKFRLGYSRNTQTGPALSTVQEFDSRGLAFPVFTDVRREYNDYRLGADMDWKGFKLSVLRRWSFFKDDSPYSGIGALGLNQAGLSGIDPTILAQFRRSEPYHGSNPGWLGNLVTSHKYWAVNARMTYVSGRRDFILDETGAGFSRFGSATNRSILVNGNAQRPVTAGDLNISLFPTKRLTIVNNTAVHSTRINGDSTFTEIDNSTNQGTTFNFRYLGVRTVSNSTDANYRATKSIGFYAAYHYSDRRVRTIEGFAIPGFAGSSETDLFDNKNHLNAGSLGIRVKPVKQLTINVDGEVGRASNPLTPVSERNYHTINGRVDYRARNLQLSTSYQQVYNVNAPVSFTTYSSHSRNYTASASWAPRSWFGLDASYMKLHLDTASGLQFFAGVVRSQLQQAATFYRSNIHAANLGARFAVAKRADVYLGYSITKDTGDGRATAAPVVISTGNQDSTGPLVGQLLTSVQTFPLSFQSPLARVSVRISPKVRWNVGYQFYNYNEKFQLFFFAQNYHAHTGYTGVLWSF